MRILHVITGLRTGGAEKMLLKLAVAMRSLGAEQRIVSLTGMDDVGSELLEAGIAVHAIGMRGLPTLLPTLLKLRAVFRGFRPDITQTWLYHADLVGGLAACLADGGKLVWGIRHSDLSRDANKRSTLAVAKASAYLSRRLPDGILFNSNRAVETHSAFGYATDKAKVILNGFDTGFFRPQQEARDAWRVRLGLSPQDVLIGWAGRNHPQKSPADFLRAASRLAVRRPEARFAMVGAGLVQGNPEFDRLIGEGNLAGRIHLLGPCKDMPGFLSSLDLFASSSVGEGFSNALAEAMCCELPCVATDVGDSAAILGATGLCSAARNPLELADNIERMIGLGASGRSGLGKAARDRVMANWSIAAIAGEYLGYYEQLIRAEAPVKRGMVSDTRLSPGKA